MKMERFEWGLLKKIIRTLEPGRKKILAASAGMLIVTVSGFFQPLVVKVITDDGLINGRMGTILSSVFLLLLLVLVNQLTQTGLTSLFADMHNESEIHIYRKTFHKLLHLKQEYFTDKNASEIINSMTTDVNTVASLMDSYSMMLIGCLFRIISGLAGLLVLSPVLTLAVLAVIPVKYFAVRKLSGIRQEKTKEYIKKYNLFDAWLSDTISGVKEIKLWNSYERKENEFCDKEKDLLNSSKKFTMIDAWNSLSENILNWLVSALLYILGGALLIGGRISLGGLFAFITYSAQVTAPMAAVLNIKMILARVMPSARRLFQFLDLEEETGGNVRCASAGRLSFERVGFAYDAGRVLEEVSFSVPAGSKTAIIGANGSGKSTILNLLLRFLEPDQGEIRLDGTDVRKLDLQEYRSLFSVVSQNPYLFSKTVRENIDLNETGDKDRLTYVCGKSGVHTYLEKLPDGENSVIGSNGARLSGGEKQKLAVARALMKDTPYIILDEATSGFDVESDAYLHDVIVHEMKDKTVLLVTHRYENLEGMDRVYRLENGRLEEIIT